MALPAFINPFLMPWMTFQPRLPQSTEVRPSHIALMIWGRAAMIWGMAWMMPTTSLPSRVMPVCRICGRWRAMPLTNPLMILGNAATN